MSALALSHVPVLKINQLTVPVSELRKNDVVIDGMDFDEPITVNKIFDPEYKINTRCLTLINSRNSISYRQFPAEMEVIIQN